MNPIEQILSGRITDLGDFQVQRVLPHAKRRWVGPFVAPIAVDDLPHPHDPEQALASNPKSAIKALHA